MEFYSVSKILSNVGKFLGKFNASCTVLIERTSREQVVHNALYLPYNNVVGKQCLLPPAQCI